MIVRNRMTANPFTVTPENTIPEAQAIMAKHSIRALPVVQDGRVVGLLSKSDIAAVSPSPATSLSAAEITYLLKKLKVAKAMSRNPITIAPGALLEEAAIAMRDHKVQILPVVDGHTLVGVITESAILDAFIELLGFRERGTRLTIAADDVPGMLAKLGQAAARHNANIQHVAVYRGQDRSTVVVGVNTPNTDALEADLAEAGFAVITKLINP
ncbi:MAG: CBS and ACT domain-containing protein [Propionibacteriaceae bacterium]|jgi:acetoin utilization protein AcuB|nr:CBS and ACT domain-containing protein [Propionibacteriaceae bacterium]